MSNAPPRPPAPPMAPPPARPQAAQRPPLRPASSAPPPTPNASPAGFRIQAGRQVGAQRIGLYGPGGIGKSSLAGLTPNPVFLDIENGTRELDVQRVEGLQTFADLRQCLQSNALDGFGTIVVDSATKAEEWAAAHTIQTIPHEKGHFVDSLEGYGFGKGLQHLYDTFLLLLQDLDRHIRAGRNVVLIAHECVSEVPNPVGEDWIRFEPHLSSPRSGKASIRNRVVQWADHVLFLGYDVAVSKDGKGKGSGTRTIYPAERPTHVAKSRVLAPEPIPVTGPQDGRVWDLMFGCVAGAGAQNGGVA